MKKAITIILTAVIVFVVVLGFLKLGDKKPPMERIELGNISINGIKIGTTMSKDKQNLIMDGPTKFEYDHVLYNVDSNNKVTKIIFHTIRSTDIGTYGVAQADVYYKDTRLKTLKDFEEIFGEGETKPEPDGYKTVIYEDYTATLRLYLKNNELLNIEIDKAK